MKLSDEAYNILKWIAMYFLPAAGTLYFAVAQIWGFPYGEEIVGTITAIDTFLGVILGISSKTYNKVGDGALLYSEDENNENYYFKIDTPLETIKKQGSITLKVQNQPTVTPKEDAETSQK